MLGQEEGVISYFRCYQTLTRPCERQTRERRRGRNKEKRKGKGKIARKK